MAEITLGGKKVHTKGLLPAIDSEAPDFTLVDTDFTTKSLADFHGNKIILNIFPSLETGICANSIRKFNTEAAALDNVKVLCISKDLPLAHGHFCETEGIKNVINLSEFRDTNFGDTYQVTMTDGLWQGLFSRAIVIINEKGIVTYTEQVPEIGQDPDFEKALDIVR